MGGINEKCMDKQPIIKTEAPTTYQKIMEHYGQYSFVVNESKFSKQEKDQLQNQMHSINQAIFDRVGKSPIQKNYDQSRPITKRQSIK